MSFICGSGLVSEWTFNSKPLCALIFMFIWYFLSVSRVWDAIELENELSVSFRPEQAITNTLHKTSGCCDSKCGIIAI